MAINKLTPLGLVTIDRNHDGRAVRVFEAHAQREGEEGLSQEVHLHLTGWEADEARAFATWINESAAVFLLLSRNTW